MERLDSRVFGADGRRLKPAPIDDWMNERQASVLACSIQDYWRRHGRKDVTAWVERVATKTYYGIRDVWVVRSNLVNGKPPSLTN